jgi:hypothetical protein
MPLSQRHVMRPKGFYVSQVIQTCQGRWGPHVQSQAGEEMLWQQIQGHDQGEGQSDLINTHLSENTTEQNLWNSKMPFGMAWEKELTWKPIRPMARLWQVLCPTWEEQSLLTCHSLNHFLTLP